MERENNKSISVEVDGLFMYRDYMTTYESISSFVYEFSQNKHDFNECYGAYRISINFNNEYHVKFSDNSGMMRFYINKHNKQLFCSLMEAETDERVPNYNAIAQFLSYGCVYGTETIVDSVYFSDPNVYYAIKNDELKAESKKLKEIKEYRKENITLKRLVRQAVAHCKGEIGCTVTGGIDSRSVLANLIHIGVKPVLAITGHKGQKDVEIAEKIADKIGLKLNIISDDIEEDNWLEYAITAADGQEAICGIYRLNKLARFLEKIGVELQFGGVNGEMYKNSFINQDFPFYFGKPKWEKFYKMKVGTFDYDMKMFSDILSNEFAKLPATMIDWLKSHGESNKSNAYLNAGYEIMQARCNHVINMFENHITIYNPLMERKMAAYAYDRNPYTLEMQAFQRHEVSSNCNDIKNIETDRGLTCNERRKTVEFVKSYLFLFKIALQRIVYRNRVDIRIDQCLENGHKNDSYLKALEYTKTIGILNNNIDISSIPAGLSDRLFTIGLFFNNIGN